MADETKDAVETVEQTAVSKNIEKILDSIEKMTVLEMSELVKALEKRFGVTAAAPMAMMAAPAAGGAAAAAADEKTEWDVVLADTGEKKFQVVKKGATKEEAEDIKKKLEEAGAKVQLK